MSGLAAAGKGKVCSGGGGVGRDLGRTLTSVPSWFCRDAKEPDTMKEESGTDVSVRSRKRKANVAVVSTKETGGGGYPPPQSYLGTRMGSAHVFVNKGSRGERLAEMVIITLLAFFFFSVSVLSLGCLVCFLGVWGLFYVSFCRIQMKKLPKLTGL